MSSRELCVAVSFLCGYDRQLAGAMTALVMIGFICLPLAAYLEAVVRIFLAVLCGFLLPLVHATSRGQSSAAIELDGYFDDWENPDVEATDPAGDASGAFDLTRVATVSDGATLFIRFDSGKSLNLQSGPIEEGSLQLQIELPRARQLVIDFRNRQAMLVSSGSSVTVPWGDIQFASLPTHAASEFEMRIDLRSLGVREGDNLQFNFDGSDQLDNPIRLTVKQRPSEVIEAIDLGKRAGDIRIASLNTLRQGAASPRAPSIKSLLGVADADIYCFNESLEEDVFRATCTKVLPASFSQTRNIHWSSTCGIVSRFPLTPLSFESEEAAAFIRVPGKGSVVVVSAHFKCCGNAGSREDNRRVEEVQLLLADFKRMREGKFGPDAADARVIVLGDFNLVGSRRPLDLLNEAGLKDILLQCPVDGSAMTWRGMHPAEPFWPGRLDYVTVQEERIRPKGGYILNTEQLGIIDPSRSKDPLASDHSMLVADLELL